MPQPSKPLPIDAVLFDYGLVLSGPPDPAAWATMKEVFQAEEQPFYTAYWRPRLDYDRGTLTGDAYWDAVATDLHHQLTQEERDALLNADITLWTQPNEPMIRWAAELQAAGIRTGILSNIGDAMETGILAQLPWLSDFHHRTFSHQLKTAKPDPSIYAHAARGLGVPAERILFLDDREENIEAARKAGMHAIQYLDHGTFCAEVAQHYPSLLPHPTTIV